jgi:hypothetical protein
MIPPSVWAIGLVAVAIICFAILAGIRAEARRKRDKAELAERFTEVLHKPRPSRCQVIIFGEHTACYIHDTEYRTGDMCPKKEI